MPDEQEPRRPNSEERVLGEVFGRKGYGADEDVAHLAPPPDDMGIGVSAPMAQGHDSVGPAADTMPVTPESENPASSERPNPESGHTSLVVMSLAGGLAFGMLLALSFGDDPAILALVALVALVAFSASCQMASGRS